MQNPCPHLPAITAPLPITHTKQHRAECGEKFYIACLELAQSLWMQGLPAQSLLQLNKSMMASIPIDASVLKKHPIPYRAIQWIIQHAARDQFLGNPTRHFQHLASRMNFKQPLPELRVARAWVCFHLAEKLLPSSKYPRDFQQIETESLIIPSIQETLRELTNLTPHQSEIQLASGLLTNLSFPTSEN